MPLDEFGREIPIGRGGGAGGSRDRDRSRSPHRSLLNEELPTPRSDGRDGRGGPYGSDDHSRFPPQDRHRDRNGGYSSSGYGGGSGGGYGDRGGGQHHQHHDDYDPRPRNGWSSSMLPRHSADRTYDRARSHSFDNSRKRKGKSESPDPGYGGRHDERQESPVRPTPSHMSTLYADEPMLCQFLWNEKRQQEPKDEQDADEPDTYEGYRKTYCLDYVRTFFNQHMDDSWFRQEYSPLEKRLSAIKNQQRAASEASLMVEELKESLEKMDSRPDPNAAADENKACNFVLNARLGNGVNKPRGATSGHGYDSIEAKLDQPLRTPNKGAPPTNSASYQTNFLPKTHAFSPKRRLYEISNVPPYVTDAQLLQALKQSCHLSKSAKEQLHVYSSAVSPKDLKRVAYFSSTDEVTKDILMQLHQSNRHSATHDSQPSHIPRKEDTHLPKFLNLLVDCNDVYGRSDVDADGKGNNPEDIPKPTQRQITLPVSTRPTEPNVKVLSVALSSTKRIAKDRRNALEMATLYDKRVGIASDASIERLLELASLRNPTDPAEMSDSLDLTIAYLRRVHLISFYGGCQRSSNIADALHKSSSLTTVHLRLRKADDILKEAEAKRGPPPEPKDDAAAAMEDEVETDLLVQRLNASIQTALEEVRGWLERNAAADDVKQPMVDAETDAAADEIEAKESEVEPVWIENHTIIDENGRARCGFHFCRKLFKDSVFLRKHLIKKHSEYLRAEMGKCHDEYMMKSWDSQERRPVPPILVDCGKTFQSVESPVIGAAEPLAADPEPDLWKREEDRRKREEEEQAAARRSQFDSFEKNRYEESAAPVPRPAPTFVDIDDMKEEKVEMAFDSVPIIEMPKKKKKKKKKLL